MMTLPRMDTLHFANHMFPRKINTLGQWNYLMVKTNQMILKKLERSINIWNAGNVERISMDRWLFVDANQNLTEMMVLHKMATQLCVSLISHKWGNTTEQANWNDYDKLNNKN